jgi:Caspase domain
MPLLSPLKSAEEDAQSVASVLQEHCDCTLVCDPLLGVNATASAVRQALKTLAVKRTDDDILLFYFAGHGFIHRDPSKQHQVYLATSDLDAHLIQEGEDSDSISLGWLRERLYEKTKAGRVLLILDCCYAGNMGRISDDLPLNTIFDLFKHYQGETNDASLRKYRVTIAATGHDVGASENPDHSMTNHLLAVLRGERHEVLNQDGEVTIGRLWDYLYLVMPDGKKPSFSSDTAARGIVLATYPEYSAQALQARQRADQREERRERLQILSAAPDGERFLRDRLESFVGRKTELEDIQQRIAAVQPSGGYVTITGQVGQGKSSIIAALIARYASTSEERERIPFHFIPFNPGPEYQVTLLRNLMARLILKYDLSDLYVASESRPALRDFFPKVLRDVAAKGGQEMIFIDGLDQIESDSNGVRDLSFLPTNPPEGIVFVLGTRPDDTLKPLTLLKPTQSYLLAPLSREDFSILLQRRQVPSLEPRLADQFYEKMQQNALYLDLLARELHNQGSITPDAIETIIRRLAENPNNIFSLALERLARRGDWHEVIKPLLGVLLVTYEPLTPWQLRTILNLDHQQIQNGLQCLSGLVTHIEQRYALYHLKFQDFLRQDEARPDKPCIFATDEEVGYHARLVQWCERDQLSTIWEDTGDSNEQIWRVYVRHHYISHLYASQQWEPCSMNDRMVKAKNVMMSVLARIFRISKKGAWLQPGMAGRMSNV